MGNHSQLHLVQSSTDIEDRIVGKTAADLLWDDGAGVQMALFDAVGKKLGTPAYGCSATECATGVRSLVGYGHACKGLGAPSADAVKPTI